MLPGVSAVDLTTETLRTERLVLRPFRTSDADAVHPASQDPDTQRWISTIPLPYTPADPRHFVEDVAMRERSRTDGARVLPPPLGAREPAPPAGVSGRPGWPRVAAPARPRPRTRGPGG